ncbi:MAG: tetratricopeptide repeat protein [Bacteroidales bacterium]|nr:tetratricopeptide repeat protein [Bacteroidales bacterium]
MYPQAIIDFTKAIELSPDYGDAYYNRAIALHLSADIQGACKDWEKAKKLGSPQADDMLDLYCK